MHVLHITTNGMLCLVHDSEHLEFTVNVNDIHKLYNSRYRVVQLVRSLAKFPPPCDYVRCQMHIPVMYTNVHVYHFILVINYATINVYVSTKVEQTSDAHTCGKCVSMIATVVNEN